MDRIDWWAVIICLFLMGALGAWMMADATG